jgi:hypothetical protein
MDPASSERSRFREAMADVPRNHREAIAQHRPWTNCRRNSRNSSLQTSTELIGICWLIFPN